MNPEWEFTRIYEMLVSLRNELTQVLMKIEDRENEILYKLEGIERLLNPPPFSSFEAEDRGKKILKDRAKIWDNEIDRSKYGSPID